MMNWMRLLKVNRQSFHSSAGTVLVELAKIKSIAKAESGPAGFDAYLFIVSTLELFEMIQSFFVLQANIY